jgi:dienelactone hydrolase
MTYNPFIKGNYPVGVRTIELTGIDDNYTTEVWYPAAEEYRGVDTIDTFKFVDELPAATQEATRDAQPAEGKRPLVMYWHGGYGHRREMAAMCIFLASHGFIVASPDFPGDHVTHLYGEKPIVKEKPVDDSAKARPSQAARVVEKLVTTDDEFLSSIIAGGVGSFGMSMGGFTTLAVNSESERFKASVAICPMCGTRGTIAAIKRLANVLRTDNWKSNASTFPLPRSADAFVIADDVRELYTRITGPKRLAVLNGAGHMHWVDNAELIHETMRARYASGEFPDPELDAPKLAEAMRPFSELCPADHAIDTERAITLSHFEAELKGNPEARAFLEGDLASKFAERRIDLEIDGRASVKVAS